MANLCVLGALDTERGHEIAAQMLQWLEPLYSVYVVWHGPETFEYEPLQFAKNLSCMHQHAPVLYLHTRGAVNVHKTTEPTHRMWREQFGERAGLYFHVAENRHPLVVCPFTGSKGITWYNGFVANGAAWRQITIPKPSDRMKYERLFCGSGIPVIGLLTCTDDGDKEDSVLAARQYLFTHYKSRS